MDALVSTWWLAEHIGDPDVVVFDTTKYLPHEPKDVLAEFRAAHIPASHLLNLHQKKPKSFVAFHLQLLGSHDHCDLSHV